MSPTRVVAAISALVFSAFMVVQFNDVDPLRWILIYGGASVLAVLKMFVRLSRAWYFVLAGIALVWALSLAPAIIENAAFTGTETEREFLGLVLICVGMWILQRLPPARSDSA